MKGRVIAIGSFDGVHLGHQSLIARTIQEAQKRGYKSTILTFRIPPKMVLDPQESHELLSDSYEKEALLRSYGIDEVIFLDFSEEVARLMPFGFFKYVLIKKLNAKGIVVGSNFRFGFHRSAGAAELVQWGEKFKIPVWVLPSVKSHGVVISSSHIRQLVQDGRFEQFHALLGHPFLIGSQVVKGRGIGKKMGVATLNLAPKHKALPRGVFIIRGWSVGILKGGQPNSFKRNNQRLFFGVCNVGIRPTFLKKSPVTVEVHILEGLDLAKGKFLFIELLKKIRNEKRFPSKTALIKVIEQDIRKADKYFDVIKNASL